MKPSEYPRQILKVLYEHYEQAGDTNMELSELKQLISVPSDGLNNALQICMEKRWVKEMSEGQPYFTYISSDGKHSTVTLTAKGISAAQKLVRPWYQKAWDYLKGHIRNIIISIIATLVAALIIYGISQLLNQLQAR